MISILVFLTGLILGMALGAAITIMHLRRILNHQYHGEHDD